MFFERKKKQVATIWSLSLKKQKIGATMQFSEGLEDSPFIETKNEQNFITNRFKGLWYK
jgi:hypothetical protein